MISSNPNLTMEFIEMNIDKKWDGLDIRKSKFNNGYGVNIDEPEWDIISENKNITFDIIENYRIKVGLE